MYLCNGCVAVSACSLHHGAEHRVESPSPALYPILQFSYPIELCAIDHNTMYLFMLAKPHTLVYIQVDPVIDHLFQQHQDIICHLLVRSGMDFLEKKQQLNTYPLTHNYGALLSINKCLNPSAGMEVAQKPAVLSSW